MPATKPAPKSAPKKVLSGVEQIGATAGQVWHCLNESGPVSFTQLVKEIDAPKDIVMQAVGWLAREGKISIEENGRSRSVSLI
jgi:hypothetical protein